MNAVVKKEKRKPFCRTVSVDVDIDESDLEENGYHHEDDCDTTDAHDPTADRQALLDWHDLTHGLSLWAMCTQEPCSILTDEFRSSR